MRNKPRGFTLVEILITGVIVGALMIVFARFMPNIQNFARRIQVQQQLSGESSTTLDTVVRFLRSGKSTSVVICSCNNFDCANKTGLCVPTVFDPPNSQINFVTVDGRWRRIYWQKQDPVTKQKNNLMMDENPAGVAALPGAPGVTTSLLGHNVVGLIFGLDSRDLSIMNVSLEFEAPLDAFVDNNGNPVNVATVVLPTQAVRMVTTQ